MHRQRSWTRLVAGALAVWFGLVTAAPAVLHGCPRAMAEAASTTDGSTEHHHHGGSDQTSNPSQVPGGCTCLGTCATATAAVLANAPEIPAGVERPHASGAIATPVERNPATTPAHARPFATAPPFRSA